MLGYSAKTTSGLTKPKLVVNRRQNDEHFNPVFFTFVVVNIFCVFGTMHNGHKYNKH